MIVVVLVAALVRASQRHDVAMGSKRETARLMVSWVICAFSGAFSAGDMDFTPLLTSSLRSETESPFGSGLDKNIAYERSISFYSSFLENIRLRTVKMTTLTAK